MKAEGRFTAPQMLALSKELWAARGAVDAASPKDRPAAIARLSVASDKIMLARACNEALDAEPAAVAGRARKRVPEGRFVDEPNLEVPQNSSPAGESPPTPPSPDSPGRADPSTKTKKKARKS